MLWQKQVLTHVLIHANTAFQTNLDVKIKIKNWSREVIWANFDHIWKEGTSLKMWSSDKDSHMHEAAAKSQFVWDQLGYCSEIKADTAHLGKIKSDTADLAFYSTAMQCIHIWSQELQGVMMRPAKVLEQVAKDWLIIEAPRLWWELSARQALAGSQVKAGEAAIKPQVKPPQMWNESHKFNFLHLQLSIDQHDFMWYQWSHNFCPFGTHYFHFRFAQTPCNAECASS